MSAALLALAVWCALPVAGERRLAAVMHRARSNVAADRQADQPTDRQADQQVAAGVHPVDRRLVLLATGSAAVAAVLVVGGPVGLLLGVAAALALPRVLRRLEPRSARERREQLAQQAPVLADLLAATLASGAPLRAALGAVATAIGAPTSDVLRPVLAAIDLGADPVAAWRSNTTPEHAAIVAAVVRAAESGAPLARTLTRIGDDLRRQRRSAVEIAARSAGVRAVAPLAACFLPAFLLLGVVPVVASLATALL